MSKEFPSQMPIYTSDNILPTDCHPETNLRTDVEFQFHDEIPATSLVYLKDVRCVCPDGSHMLTRIVESDLRKVAQKIQDERHPFSAEPTRRLEENLTERDVKRGAFQFDVHTKPGTTIPQIGAISFCGSAALTAIADTDELKEKSSSISGLYDGVWANEIVSGSNNPHHARSVKVLKSKYPHLFNKQNSQKHNDNASYISTFDACELLRLSLNKCVLLLRNSKGGLNIEEFSDWAETHYQASILLFGPKGLTPYKLKLLLIPRLVQSGFIKNPWNHLCEAMEKSNHHAHKDYQTRTMRGGGTIHNRDPLYMENFFSFCKFLRMIPDSGDISAVLHECAEQLLGLQLDDCPSDTYLQTCQKPLVYPRIAIGEERRSNELLVGMRFYVIGSFGGTEAAREGQLCNPKIQPQDMVVVWIEELGGLVHSKSTAQTLLYSHSRTPNCFIIVKDDRDLMLGTTAQDDVGRDAIADTETNMSDNNQRRKKKCGISSTTNCSDNPAGRASAAGKQRKVSAAALNCRKFAGGDFIFLRLDYITDTRKSNIVLDPENYRLMPGEFVRKIIVNDVRPLLLDQCTGNEENNRISSIVALRRHRQGLEKGEKMEKYRRRRRMITEKRNADKARKGRMEQPTISEANDNPVNDNAIDDDPVNDDVNSDDTDDPNRDDSENFDEMYPNSGTELDTPNCEI
jgi:hypothetical protein